eukprot:5190008-Prymnesium_polylepis.1
MRQHAADERGRCERFSPSEAGAGVGLFECISHLCARHRGLIGGLEELHHLAVAQAARTRQDGIVIRTHRGNRGTSTRVLKVVADADGGDTTRVLVHTQALTLVLRDQRACVARRGHVSVRLLDSGGGLRLRGSLRDQAGRLLVGERLEAVLDLDDLVIRVAALLHVEELTDHRRRVCATDRLLVSLERLDQVAVRRARNVTDVEGSLVVAQRAHVRVE